LNVRGNFNVTGESTQKGNVSASGSLTVAGATQLNNTLTVTKETKIENKLTVKEQLVAESKIGIKNNNPRVELDVTVEINATGKLTVGSVMITEGIIQKGASQITTENENPDLGLYSQETGRGLRFVTNQSDFYFSSAGGYGDAKKPTLKLDKDGNMTAKGKITGSSASFTGDLKVTGQIKGKIWHSTEYEAEFEYIMQPNGVVMSKEEKKEVKMLPCKNSVAFLTSICGQFNGDGERVWIEKRE
jgi:hypothetical protein